MTNSFPDLQKASAQIMSGFQKLGELNMEVAKATFADAAKAGKTLMAAKTPQEFASLCAAELQTVPAKATAYGTQVREIFTATKA